MARLSEVIKSADWKTEKHAPVIEVPSGIQAGEPFDVKVSLGKAIAHPNTTEHHIAWMSVYFQPEGAPAPYQVGHFGRWAEPGTVAHGAERGGDDPERQARHLAGAIVLQHPRGVGKHGQGYVRIELRAHTETETGLGALPSALRAVSPRIFGPSLVCPKGRCRWIDKN